MVLGKIIGNFNGETREKEIEPCNMTIAFGIRKPGEESDDEGFYTQQVALGDNSLDIYVIIEALSRATVEAVADLTGNPLMGALLLQSFADEVITAKNTKLTELTRQIRDITKVKPTRGISHSQKKS